MLETDHIVFILSLIERSTSAHHYTPSPMSVNDGHHAGPSKANIARRSPEQLEFNIRDDDSTERALERLQEYTPAGCNKQHIRRYLWDLWSTISPLLSRDPDHRPRLADFDEFKMNIDRIGEDVFFDFLISATMTGGDSWRNLVKFGVHGTLFVSFYPTHPAHGFV